MLPVFSVIILSYNSQLDKANAIQSCLLSILVQEFSNYEVIVVENSTDKSNVPVIEDFLKNIIEPSASFQLINLSKTFNKGMARNIGAERAKGDILLFIDDDTFILERTAFQTLYRKSTEADFACGATRYWTSSEWNVSMATDFNNAILSGAALDFFKEEPPSFIRGQEDVSSEKISFIGNFGFCRRDVFKAVGGFPNFPIKSCEDDYLLLQLALKGYRFINLAEVEVLHVCHHVREIRQHEYYYYLSKIAQLGILEFDAVALISCGSDLDVCIIRLSGIHYDSLLESCYNHYLELRPLNIDSNSENEINYWRTVCQLSIQDFSMILSKMIQAENLERFTQSQSVDFDNLAPVIQAVLDRGLINLDSQGNLSSFEFEYAMVPSIASSISIVPNSKLNQFPCDGRSVKNRLDLLKARYPFCKYLPIGLIGDDDLFSALLVDEFWIYPTILEKDKQILDIIRLLSDRFVVKEVDLTMNSLEQHLKSFSSCKTFICDPPYTKSGVLLFIYAGLLLVKDFSNEFIEFYLIVNTMILGRSFFDINAVLSSCNIHLYETIPHFSHYPFPKHYAENTRAEQFLYSINDKISLEYSSTSNLFIYRTKRPDLNKLKASLSASDIYDHFK